MEITLYINKSQNNVVDKQLSAGLTLTGTLKESTSIIQPVLTLKGDVYKYNYCYIKEFNRYYYITNITSLYNGLWSVACKVDVLKTYANQLKRCEVITDNCKDSGKNKYLPDSVWTSTVKDRTEIKTFPAGLNDDGEFILITCGG